MAFEISSDWRRVLRYAWSVRLNILAGLLSAAEALLTMYPGFLPISPTLLPVLVMITVCAAFVARILVQKEFTE